MLSGTFQGISLLDGGSTVYDAVANEDSSGSSCAARTSAQSWRATSTRIRRRLLCRLYRYAEWHVGNISAELRSLTYPCCPNEPWPVIAYDVRLTREQTFFVRRARAHPSPLSRPRLNAGYPRGAVQLLPSHAEILFSVLALLSAFLPPDSGERLGFGVTLVLAREFCKARRSYELHVPPPPRSPAFPINNRRSCSG